VTGDAVTGLLDGQRRAWEMAAEFVEKTDAGAEQVVRMMTAEVGHTDSDVVYEENKLQVERYRPAAVEHETPILFVYALVNRPYILDLQPDRSVIRRLVAAGFEVYLVDWGEPSVLDSSLTLEDYVSRYMDNCIDAVCADAGVDDLHLVGYCMGGSMTIMYTALDDEKVRTLGLMATPLAFEGTGGILERWATHYDPDVAVETLGNMPAELLAFEFSMMDPVDQYITKYVTLYENIEDDAFVENFARMEQWIWDGVDVAGETFRTFITDVYQGNRLIDSEFELGGERVDLADIEVPLLQIVGEYDHIVPSESSIPLHDEIGSDDDRLIEFPAGHIGISVSSKAHDRLWPEVADWFATRSPRDLHPDLTVREEADTAGREPEATDLGADSTTGADSTASADSTADDVRAATTVQNVSAAAAAAVQRAESGAVDDVAATGAGGGDADATSDSLESVEGIGPTYARRLTAAGIETRTQLAAHDAQELADIADTYPGRAEAWLQQVA
jgi:polyhydroxyalkanoate synthase